MPTLLLMAYSIAKVVTLWKNFQKTSKNCLWTSGWKKLTFQKIEAHPRTIETLRNSTSMHLQHTLKILHPKRFKKRQTVCVTCSSHVHGNLADTPSVSLSEQQDYEVKLVIPLLVTQLAATYKVTVCTDLTVASFRELHYSFTSQWFNVSPVYAKNGEGRSL